MPSVAWISLVPFLPHGQIYFSTSLNCSDSLFPTLLNYLIVHMTFGGLWLFLDGICFYAMSLLVACATCLCVSGMTNIITVPYTWLYHSYFPHYHFGSYCIHPDFAFFGLFTLFWWCQKGEDEYDLFFRFGLPSLSQPLNFCFYSCVAWIFGIDILMYFALHGHLRCHHQKGGNCFPIHM